MTVLLTVPLFFSGFVFSSELKISASMMAALPRTCEYDSVYFWFRSPYFFALIMYGPAFEDSIRARL